jgi:hypothetical protein
MATTLQFRRGTSQEAAAFTGAVGELFVDIDNNIVYLHDGSTAGGHRVTTIQDTDTNTYLASGAIEGSTLTLTMSDSSKVLVDVSTLLNTSYSDSDVDTHLNIVEAAAGQFLQWSGLDYTWSTLSSGSADLTAVDTDIIPIFDEVYDIGSSDLQWYETFTNILNVNGSQITSEDGIISTTSDVVVGSLLADNLFISENMIIPDDTTALAIYFGDKGVVDIQGNLQINGDWVQMPVVETVGEIAPSIYGIEGFLRFNKDEGAFEGYDGTAWGSLGGISADEDGNATIDANLIVTGDVISLSDATIKENIKPIESALDIINKLNGVKYNLIDSPEKEHVGLIAQEVQEVLPEVVYKSNEKLAVAYGNIVAVLIEAVKELQEEVNALKGV